MTDPFATSEEISEGGGGKVFGERYNGRYHLPLLPGEKGTKSGGNWVPWGVQSATNLAGSIVESRMLGIWDRERTQLGMALDQAMYERLAFIVRSARAKGVDFDRMSESDQGKALKAELALLHEESSRLAGATAARLKGTIRHDVWEERAKSGELFGTPGINAQVEALESLMDRKGLERVPGLQERTVRNVALKAAGRFDDVLRDRVTGQLYMADLKTKRRAFYSWLEVRIQLTVYATAEWMLHTFDPAPGSTLKPEYSYVQGPKHHVDQRTGIILHMPSDGAEPQLKRVDLIKGWEHAMLARQVCDARADAKSSASHAAAETPWPDWKG